MKCNNRIKELMAERCGKENKEDRDHNKKETPRTQRSSKEKIRQLNKMKKDYELGKKQRESRNHEENTQVESMIEVVEDQINDLFKEENTKMERKMKK